MAVVQINQVGKMKKAELIEAIKTFHPEFTGKGMKVADLRNMLKVLLEGQTENKAEAETVVSDLPATAEKRTKKAAKPAKKKELTEEESLAKLDKRIVRKTKRNYSMEIGEYEILIPRKPTGDIIEDLKVGYMFVASDVELMEGNVDFEMDLVTEAADVVRHVKAFMPEKEPAFRKWLNAVEEAADESIEAWEEEPDEADEEDAGFEDEE